MKIAFTWDYELFFGEKSGTVQQCMIQPTKDLLDIAERHQAKFTFFPDAGYLLHAKKQEGALPDLKMVVEQIKAWDLLGHETGLHIHPHWEDVVYENKEWKHNTSRYKLSDFNEADVDSIIHRYFKEVQQLISSPINSFRAGGWCVQPFRILGLLFYPWVFLLILLSFMAEKIRMHHTIMISRMPQIVHRGVLIKIF